MKKILNLAAIMLLTVFASAQTCQSPVFNQMYSNNPNGSGTFFGDVAVFGEGIVNSGNSFYNFQNIKFEGTSGDMFVYWPFNGQNGQTLVLAQNSKYKAGISLTGNNTVLILGNNVTIDNLIGNNSNTNQVLISPGDSFLVNQVYYKAGMVIPGANPSNNIPVNSCFGSPLGSTILRFYEDRGTIFWETSIPAILEYQTGGYWGPEYAGTEDFYKASKSGLYRLRVGTNYSKVLPVNLEHGTYYRPRIYDLLGRKLFEAPISQPYIEDGVKKIIIK